MEIICVILSGLALLSAVINLALFFREKKRSERHNRASDTAYVHWFENLEATLSEHEKQHGELAQRICAVEKMCDESIEMRPAFVKRLEDLEEGICPGYEKAIDSKEVIDELSAGLMGLLTYGEPVKKENRERDGESR